jgi:hypothetical protein
VWPGIFCNDRLKGRRQQRHLDELLEARGDVDELLRQKGGPAKRATGPAKGRGR